MAQIIKNDEFETVVLKSDKPVLVDFFATWCMPCKMLAPVLDQVSETVADYAKVVKLDIDENMDLARKYGVMSVPTMVVIKNGSEVDRMVGFRQANQITNVLQQYK